MVIFLLLSSGSRCGLARVHNISTLIRLNRLNGTTIRHVNRVIRTIPINNLQLSLLLRPKNRINIKTNALSRMNALTNNLNLQLMTIGTTRRHRNRRTLTITPTRSRPRTRQLRQSHNNLLTRSLSSLFRHRMLNLMLIRHISSLRNDRHITHGASRSITISLTSLKRIIFRSVKLFTNSKFLSVTTVTSRNTRNVATCYWGHARYFSSFIFW